MNKKIIGMFVCMLLIGPVVSVTGDVNVQTACKADKGPPGDWVYKNLFIGFISDLDESVPGKCTFHCVFVFYSNRYEGKITDRSFFRNVGGGASYDEKTGFVGQHFICCMFKWNGVS